MSRGVFLMTQSAVGEVRLELAGVRGEALESRLQALQGKLLAGCLLYTSDAADE